MHNINNMINTDKINLNLPYNFDTDELIKLLSDNMFYSLNLDNEKILDNECKQNKNNESINVPRFLKYVDYNKFNSKYNEKKKLRR